MHLASWLMPLYDCSSVDVKNFALRTIIVDILMARY